MVIPLARPITCGHCATEIPAGQQVYIHCRQCSWVTCPVCGAQNSRNSHTHKDHPKKCPARGFK